VRRAGKVDGRRRIVGYWIQEYTTVPLPPNHNFAADRSSLVNSTHLEQRARELHSEAIVLLAHDHFLPPDGLDDLVTGGVTGKILMTVVDSRAWAPTTEDYKASIPQIDGWFEYARAVYQRVRAAMDAHPEWLLLRNSQDVLEAKRNKRVGVLLGAEGGKMVGHNRENLQALYTLGVRHILLSWAFNNQLTAAELDKGGSGLTAFGREVVAEMNRLGMIIDTTHVSRPSMREILAISKAPILNSHTALKSISNRLPALTEDEIRATADRGGVLAVHFMTHMLTGRFRPQATLDELVNQIDAMVRVGGINCVALGPDYLPYNEDFKRNTEQRDLTFPTGLESPSGLPRLTAALLVRGYSEADVLKILGGNLLRLFREVLD
jgi:membrane dipeptidase